MRSGLTFDWRKLFSHMDWVYVTGVKKMVVIGPVLSIKVDFYQFPHYFADFWPANFFRGYWD